LDVSLSAVLSLHCDAGGERRVCADHLRQHCGIVLYNAVGVGGSVLPLHTSLHG